MVRSGVGLFQVVAWARLAGLSSAAFSISSSFQKTYFVSDFQTGKRASAQEVVN
jgi:hypothetical protein